MRKCLMPSTLPATDASRLNECLCPCDSPCTFPALLPRTFSSSRALFPCLSAPLSCSCGPGLESSGGGEGAMEK